METFINPDGITSVWTDKLFIDALETFINPDGIEKLPVTDKFVRLIFSPIVKGV